MSKTLIKAHIADSIYDGTDCTRPESNKIVESLLAAMKTAIKRDRTLLVTGKFEAYQAVEKMRMTVAHSIPVGMTYPYCKPENPRLLRFGSLTRAWTLAYSRNYG